MWRRRCSTGGRGHNAQRSPPPSVGRVRSVPRCLPVSARRPRSGSTKPGKSPYNQRLSRIQAIFFARAIGESCSTPAVEVPPEVPQKWQEVLKFCRNGVGRTCLPSWSARRQPPCDKHLASCKSTIVFSLGNHHAQDENQEKRRKALSGSRQRIHQAWSGVQASHPDQEDDQGQAPAARFGSGP